LKDLDKNDVLAKSEIGFIKFIVKPLWETLNKFLGYDLNLAVANFSKNLDMWEQ